MRAFVIAGLTALVVAGSSSLQAWGMDVHRVITEHAVDRLPAEIKPFFLTHKSFIAEHSVDPDLWRVMDLTGARGEEPPNHFLDIDFEEGTKPPFDNVPRDYDEYVKKFGVGPATRWGRLPWRAQEVYDRLVTNLRDIGKPNVPYAADNARYLMAVLAHYVEDAHVPFHGALNYDGQITNQRGIHSRFESELILRNPETWTWAATPVAAIPDFKAFMFKTVIDSQQLVATVLSADVTAANGREFYDAAYFDLFLKGAGPIADRRLTEAASAVASAVYSAWIEAGKPALSSATSDRTPARIRR